MSDQELGQNLMFCHLVQELERAAPRSEADDVEVMECRVRGTVEKFAPKRGFGLISAPDGGSHVFAHWTQISSNDAWPRLPVGETIEYTPAIEDGKMVAKRITAPGGGPIDTVEEVVKTLRVLSDFYVTGTVQWFTRAGYGFIQLDAEIEWPTKCPAGAQIYVSREDLVMAEGSVCGLQEGMRVQFRVFDPLDKPVAAAEVTSIGGAPIVCQALPPKGAFATTPRARSGGTGDLIASTRGLGERLISGPRPTTGVQRTIQKPPARQAAGRQTAAAGAGARGPLGLGSGDELEEAARQWLQAAGGHAPPAAGAGADARGASDGGGGEAPAAPAAAAVPGGSADLEESARQWLQEQAAVLDPGAGHAPAATPCKYFLAGRCAKGDACRFQHAAPTAAVAASDVLSAALAAAGAAADGFAAPVGTGVTRRIPCRYFATGRCARGAACQFSHGEAADACPVPLSERMAEECAYFKRGQCMRGAACLWAHGPVELLEILLAR
ncbi:unnamed protein product, partial [Prorocentrum cordatum]